MWSLYLIVWYWNSFYRYPAVSIPGSSKNHDIDKSGNISLNLKHIASGGLHAVLKLISICSVSCSSISTPPVISHLVSQLAMFQSYHLESCFPLFGNDVVWKITLPSASLWSSITGNSPSSFGMLFQSGDGIILPKTESFDSKMSLTFETSSSLPKTVTVSYTHLTLPTKRIV